jgi:uncharacterized alpha-E superfamily protein
VIRTLSQTSYASAEQEPEALKELLRTITYLTGTQPGFLEERESVTSDDRLKEIHKVICDPDLPGSILFTVNNLLKATYAVRDKWTVDNWRIIDDIENVKRRLAILEPENIRHVFSLLDQLNLDLLAFLEMNRQSMYRGEGWVMYRIGQLIEELGLELTQYRSLLTLPYEESSEIHVLEALLVSNFNLSNYRAVYRTYFDIEPALDLLFFNKQNPISVLSQLEQLLKCIEQLPSEKNGINNDAAISIAFECYSRLRLLTVDKLATIDEETGVRLEMDKVCGHIAGKIGELSVMLSATYFSHSTYQHQSSKDNFQFEV